MSAALKTSSALGGLALVGAAMTYAFKSPNTDFSQNALAAAEHAAPSAVAAVKPKLYVLSYKRMVYHW